MTESPFVDSSFAVHVFSLGDDPIACLNKAMAFLTVVASSRGDKGKLILVLLIRTMLQVQREILQLGRQELLNATTSKTAQAVLLANISNYGSDVISKVPNSETYLNDMDNQSVHALQHFEQSPTIDFTDNEISGDSNIIPYSQYLQESQQANEKANKEQNNESITAELERYKERVKTFEQRLNIDLSSRGKMIDSQMDDIIREKLTLKEQIDSLEQNLSKQIKEKESVLQTIAVFKNESKEKENKYMETEIDLEKKIKEL
ncbi:hypothetical protein Tco_0676849, partial [Tanacetum coccineum]